MNLNKVFIIGRLTNNPQLRSTSGGQQVAGFGVATNRVWTDKNGQKQESTEFHNIVVWGRQAEIASQFLTKGSLVFIEGRLQTREWQDKQNQPRRTTEIIAERIQLGPKPATRNAASQPAASFNESFKSEIPTIEADTDENISKEEITEEDLQF